MEWNKLSLPDHFLCPRRKVLSGFGLGIGVSVIVLALFFLNNSLKGSPLEHMLQGFQSVGAHASSVSESFSAATISHSSFSSANTSTTSELQSSVDFVNKPRVLNRTHVENTNENITVIENLDGDKVNGGILENTHFGNSNEKLKNGSFTDESGTFQLQTQEPNLPMFAENGGILENTHFGNSNDKLKNGSFTDESGTFQLQTQEPNLPMFAENGLLGNGTLLGNEERAIGNFSQNQDVNADKAIVNTTTDHSSNVDNNASEITSFSSLGEKGKASIEKNNTVISTHSQIQNMQSDSYETCDIFDGRWVRDNSKPYYPSGSCPLIDRDFNCHVNRRPDHGYVKWKWKPNGCSIPSLNATDFLERLRGKRLVFVGDSLNRNMWESLVCILRQSLRYKRRVHEISGRTEFKKKGVYAFRFEDYNCSLDFVASPFLVRESSFSGKNGTFETLRLDLMDKTTSTYHDADFIVFNTGHWWTHEKTSKGEDYYQEGKYVHPRLKVLEAYKRALTTWARWVDKNIDHNRALVFFRGYSATHFSGGQWNSGGQCHKEMEPIFNQTYLNKYPSKMRALEYVLQEMKTPVVYLNITRLTDYRKDGHPSIYRMKYKTVEQQIAAERSQDCSHWCLPGVPDTWNELLYASILKATSGS